MNLSSIVVLLQLVLTLLSNPSAAQNTQTQALASQAIGYATQALKTAITSSSTAPSLSSVSQTTTQTPSSTVATTIPSNCPSEILDPSQLSLLPAGCPMPAIVGQQLQNSEAASNSAKDIQELQYQYTNDLGSISNTPGLSEQQAQGEENALNKLYNVELQAAQLDAPCFSPNLTLGGGVQGLEALQSAMDCVASAQ